jgi:hypothetical protein
MPIMGLQSPDMRLYRRGMPGVCETHFPFDAQACASNLEIVIIEGRAQLQPLSIHPCIVEATYQPRNSSSVIDYEFMCLSVPHVGLIHT